MNRKLKVNKKCAKLLGLEIHSAYEDADYISVVVNSRIIDFNIYDPEKVDAYKVAAKLELDINFTKVSEIWFVDDYFGHFRAEDKNQYTAIVKCIETVIGDL